MFKLFHPEQIPSAIDRYVKEVNRVTGVLEGHLAKQQVEVGSDGPWLVGGRISYADIAFLSWQAMFEKMSTKEDYDEDRYPHVKEWVAKMKARKGVKAVMEEGTKKAEWGDGVTEEFLKSGLIRAYR